MFRLQIIARNIHHLCWTLLPPDGTTAWTAVGRFDADDMVWVRGGGGSIQTVRIGTDVYSFNPSSMGEPTPVSRLISNIVTKVRTHLENRTDARLVTLDTFDSSMEDTAPSELLASFVGDVGRLEEIPGWKIETDVLGRVIIQRVETK